jgi:DNA-binding response OmpR family regulator
MGIIAMSEEKKRILVVDDDSDIRNIVEIALEAEGYEVLTGANGNQALEIIEREPLDLILLDLMMPEKSGYVVCKQIKADEKYKNIPVLVMSAIDRDSGQTPEFWNQAVGSDDFLSKPFEVSHMMGKVKYLLSRDEYVSTKKRDNGNGDSQETAQGEPAIAAVSAEVDTGPKKILIAEDDEDILESIKIALESKNFDVVIASDGRAASSMIRVSKPDLVIMDVKMPFKDGLSICRECKADPELSKIPIIIVTGMTQGSEYSDEEMAKGVGCDDFITKPFDPLNLLIRAERLLAAGSSKIRGMAPQPPAETAPQQAPDAGEAAQPADNEISKDLSVMEPDEVVKTFIEAWNTKAFKTEYHCLSREFVTIIEEDYLASRHHLSNTISLDRVELSELLSSDIKDDEARIVCTRTDYTGKVKKVFLEHYTLKNEDDGWKIIGVRRRSK